MSSTIWPGSIITGGIVPALTTKSGGLAAAPVAPPTVAPLKIVTNMKFTPAPTTVSLVGQSALVNPVTTQQAIYTFFRIINPTVTLPNPPVTP